MSNDFFSETTGPIATKFHMQPVGPLGTKSCSNGLGQMTKTAAMPIYGKNLKGLLHCFSTCIEIIGKNWYCFILKNVENCKKKILRVKKL